jgi:hypothetical protein
LRYRLLYGDTYYARSACFVLKWAIHLIVSNAGKLRQFSAKSTNVVAPPPNGWQKHIKIIEELGLRNCRVEKYNEALPTSICVHTVTRPLNLLKTLVFKTHFQICMYTYCNKLEHDFSNAITTRNIDCSHNAA